MRTTRNPLVGLMLVGLMVSSLASNVEATEGGIGRPITGTGVSPGMGIVPPPGAFVTYGGIRYSGTVNAERATPLSGQVALGIEPEFWMGMAEAIYGWKPKPAGWSLASGVLLPYVWMDIATTLESDAESIETTDDASGTYDIAVIPIIIGKHLSKVEHVSLALTVWTPSGDYNVTKLANPSMNVWTYVPSIAYTKYAADNDLEFTGSLGFQFYTENEATHYKSGVLSTFDFLAIEKVSEETGMGAVFGWIEQLTDDSGVLANRLDGFRGRSFGIGPIVTYKSKIGDLNFRWVNEFNTKNRPDGNVYQLNLTKPF
jgi:hypothetical protein